MATHAYRLKNPDLINHAPPRPRRLSDLGMSIGVVRDLILRTMFTAGSPTGMEICRTLCLPFNGVIEAMLDAFIRDQMVNFKGGGAFGRATYEYVLTEKGREQAREAVERCAYVGPAPVPLNQYMHLVRRQMRDGCRVSKAELREAMADLVLEDDLLDRLGPAVNSMRSLFLYGPPGNGKTSIAERMANLLPGEIFVPYALLVENQIIQVYDPIVHKALVPIPEEELPSADELELELEGDPKGRITFVPSFDERWALSQRPCIMTGGELTLDSLDLNWDAGTRTYQAPFQLKACEGLLLIDDFGRQKVHPRDLLNRWIVPLEKGVDYLTLRTGSKFEVPFDLLTIFSTNIDPSRLVDAAFLRRIRYKIEIKAPDELTFREIFEAEAVRQGMPYNSEEVDYILDVYYRKGGREPRCCHPRDLLQLVSDISRFLDVPPRMSRKLVDQACQTYFVHMEGDAPDAPPPDVEHAPPQVLKARSLQMAQAQGDAQSVTPGDDIMIGGGTSVRTQAQPTQVRRIRPEDLRSFDDDASPTVSIPVPKPG